MDPLSQATLGAALAVAASRKTETRAACLAGVIGGLAPDLDVFLGSPSDPLLFLEFHRQFTHSFVFIPVGGLLAGTVVWLLLGSRWPFRRIWLYATLGYATHGILDACTSYGTQLFWPFTSHRVAWNNMPIIDPVFTLLLLALVVAATVRRSEAIGRAAMVWALTYLMVGGIQNIRVTAAAESLVAARGHEPLRLEPKPGFGSLILWKVVYEHDGRYYVDAFRATTTITVYPGESIAKLDVTRQFPWLTPDSQQARDIERFRWFSQDFLAYDPSHDWIVDMRYSNLPHQIDGLWGIRLRKDAGPSDHVNYITRRGAGREQTNQHLAMLRGVTPLDGEAPLVGE